MRALDRFSNDLMGNLERFITVEDSSGVGTIWTCCIICLAHLAALCHFISQMEPASSGYMDDLYDLTLDKLGNLSLEVHIEEYTRFDVLTGVRILAISLRMNIDTNRGRLNRCLGGGCWTPLTHVSGCAPTLGADHCDIGEGLSERRMPIFKQIFQGMNRSCSLRWPWVRMVGLGALVFLI